MNLRNEMSIWRYRKVTVALDVRECKLIHDSIRQFAKEYSEKKQEFFRESFSSQIVIEDASTALDFFEQLININADLQELISLVEKEKKSNESLWNEISEFSFESQDPFGFNLASQISDVGSKEISIEIALLPLVTALKISDVYEQEVNYRNNNQISSLEHDDWTPPSNFANGTDAEKEIWEDFQRSQKLRK